MTILRPYYVSFLFNLFILNNKSNIIFIHFRLKAIILIKYNNLD